MDAVPLMNPVVFHTVQETATDLHELAACRGSAITVKICAGIRDSDFGTRYGRNGKRGG
jgi:hypothetical protein